ncbi:unnamed protein product [Discula destructiva]
MSPARNRGDRRVSLPHHPGHSQSANSTPVSGLAQQPQTFGPRTTYEEWEQIERKYYADARKAAQLEDTSMGEKYQHKTAPIKAMYGPLLEKRARLQNELDAIQLKCDEMEDELTQIDMHYFEAKEIIEKRRSDQDQIALKFFTTYKNMARRQADGMGNDREKRELMAAATGVATGNLAASSACGDTAINDQVRLLGARVQQTGLGSLQSSPLSLPPDDISELTGVEVWDSDGKFVDRVKKINLANRHVRNILQLRPKRAVVVREGRKFNKETMASIYEPSDVKGAKWLSCMIQATGEEQDVACEPCRNKSGTWAGCIIVGGVDFPRCANCEWNRQGCVGSSYHQDRSQDPDLQQAPQSPYIFSETSAPPSREGSYGFTPVNGSSLRQDSANSTPARNSLPSTKGARNPLPSMAPPVPYDDSFQGGGGEDQLDPGPEISNETLHLEDDGKVFTAPEIMRGVPVEPISPTHPYWDKNWEPVETSILAKLSEWQAKLAECLATQPKKRFLAQRQVNRGKTILEFLQNGPIHPYQLVGKKFISKALISYDTVFRLAQVIEELPKFGVNVDPVAWLRERMHQLYSEQGESFSLSRTVHDLYRDPKLQFLRNRAGFGNIGRPCGVKKGMTSKYPGGIRPKDPRLPPPPRAKRNGPALENKSASKKPRNENGTASSSPCDKSEPVSPRVQQAIGLDADEGYTSVDSSSGEVISDWDWHIDQLKTDTSQPGQSYKQYWHWVNRATKPYFEHQIMTKDGKWKVFPEPHNFHLYPHEIEKIQLCIPDCLKMIIHTVPVEGVPHRGRILVQFKRLRTMQRFLSFLETRKPVEDITK